MTSFTASKINQPLSTMQFKFIADSPTTTRKRLRSLFTGNIPVFRDILMSFTHAKLFDDNTYYQLKVNSHKTVCMGEPVLKLLPSEYFVNVRDDASIANISDCMTRRTKDFEDWDIVLAHFNSIDHIAHVTHNRCSPEVIDELMKANTMSSVIIDQLSPNGIYFAYGDHGLTPQGGHSMDEEARIAALFFRANKPLLFMLLNSPTSTQLLTAQQKIIIRDLKYTLKFDTFPFNKQRNSLSQMSLVPTMASFTQTPIPYTNLGYIIPEAFPFHSDRTISSQIFDIIFEYMINIAQIQRFIYRAQLYEKNYLEEFDTKYSKFRGEFLSLIPDLDMSINLENNLIDTTSSEHIEKIKDFIGKSLTLMNKCQELLDLNLDISRKVWANNLKTNILAFSYILIISEVILIVIWLAGISIAYIENYEELLSSPLIGKLGILVSIFCMGLLYYTKPDSVYDYLVLLLLCFTVAFNLLFLLITYLLPLKHYILGHIKLHSASYFLCFFTSLIISISHYNWFYMMNERKYILLHIYI